MQMNAYSNWHRLKEGGTHVAAFRWEKYKQMVIKHSYKKLMQDIFSSDEMSEFCFAMKFRGRSKQVNSFIGKKPMEIWPLKNTQI